MTHFLKIAIAVVLVSMAFFMVYNRFFNPNHISTLETTSTKMPNFEFEGMDSKALSYKNLEQGKESVISFFHPDCAHCQELAANIFRKKKRLQNTNILMVSTAPIDKITKFAADFNLLNQPNILFATDTKGSFFAYFGDAFVPMLLVYDAEKQQKAVIKGDDISINEVLEAVETN